MADRPINLRDWQVRAAVEGRLKVLVAPIKPQPTHRDDGLWDWAGRHGGVLMADDAEIAGYLVDVSPLIVGDRYWARETWAEVEPEIAPPDFPDGRLYRASWPYEPQCKPIWRSPVTMPRRLSRITIVPTEARAARLHDLTRDDAIGTGVITDEWREWREDAATIGLPPGSRIEDEIGVFARHWDTKDGPTAWNGPGSYERNPWVCIARCDVHLRNIDTLGGED